MTETTTAELVPTSEATGIVESFNSSQAGVYSSYKSDDFSSKIQLASALSNSQPIADHLGETIELAHVVLQAVQLTNEDTGELEESVRSILIDKDGKAYNAVSYVIVNRLRDIIGVLGEPHTWPAPVKVRVDRVKGKGANFFYDLQVLTK